MFRTQAGSTPPIGTRTPANLVQTTHDHASMVAMPRQPPPKRRPTPMPSTTVTVGSEVGLHARPADIISKKAAELEVDVTLATPGGDPVDAGSALMIMTLGAERGDEVVVESDDEAAMQRIADLVVMDLDDEDLDPEEL